MDALTASFPSGGSLQSCSLALPLGAVVGLVTPPGQEADDVLGLLSGDSNPESGRAAIDGVDVRVPSVAHHVFYVPNAADALSASARELLQAVAPDISDATARSALESVGLEHVLELPHKLAMSADDYRVVQTIYRG